MNGPDKLEFVGFWKRVIAALIDILICLPLGLLMLPLDYWALENDAALVVAARGLIGLMLFMWLVVRFGGTPGKLLIGIRIVDGKGAFLGWGTALRRELPGVVGVVLGTAALNAAAPVFPGFDGEPTFDEYALAISNLGGPFFMLHHWWAWFELFDLGVILFNKRKRAIHDFLAGSYVVTKNSFLSVQPAHIPTNASAS